VWCFSQEEERRARNEGVEGSMLPCTWARDRSKERLMRASLAVIGVLAEIGDATQET